MPVVKFSFLILASLIYLNSYGQPSNSPGPLQLDNIITHTIKSSIIGEEYTIYVLKTDNYDTTGTRLPVLYMMDGDWSMTVAMNCFRMLRQDYATHEPLVVGIGYGKNQNMRVRDLDPKNGGPEFLSFIEKEVMPFIDKTYRTTKEKAVYGYSMGGMFTTYILFNRSDLFQKIFIGAPGNNGGELMPAAREYFKNHNDLKSKVFIGVGSFEKGVVRNIDSFTTYLNSKKLPDLDINTVITPDAGHGAALAQVMQNAIAYGYCEKHKPISINASSLKKYAGNYILYENNTVSAEANVFSKDGKLFLIWKQPNAIADELVSFGTNEFFVPANERMSFKFTNKELIISVAADKDYHLVKK
ncbi:MAG: hypothetical protein JNK79_17590 [Chitinophagaceae bacterium]|nr:hypothetical protein [Chitinophagaceae bacterium]